MNRRILCVAPSAYTLGGAQTWLDYLLPGLVDKGWDVTLGLVSGRLHDADAYLAAHPFAPVCQIEAPTGTREGRVRALMTAVEQERPNVVLVLNVVDCYEAVARLRRRCGSSVKLVATLHGLQPDYLEDFKRLRDHLDAVVCSNRLAAALVVETAGMDESRVLYAPYGVRVRDRNPERSFSGGTLKLAYSGRLETAQKRVIDAVRILKSGLISGLDLTLDVAGAGPAEQEIRECIDREALRDQVTLHGSLDPETLRRRVYQSCDVLLLTSSWETGPIVAWEAMSEGLVLLTSDYLGRRREGALTDKDNCCVFPVGDIEKAVEALRILKDPALRRRLSVAGHDLVTQTYNIVRSVDLWSQSLERVCHFPALAVRDFDERRSAAGRLDRYFGTKVGEIVRQILRRSYSHANAGGEWPHSYGGARADDPGFWATASRLDAPGGEA